LNYPPDFAPKTYQCPADPTYFTGSPGIPNGPFGPTGWAVTSYVMNGTIFDGWGVRHQYPGFITDGTSNTIFFTEDYAFDSFTYLQLGFNNIWWWDYNTFQQAGGDGQIGAHTGLYGPAYTPMIQPSVGYCLSNTPNHSLGPISACSCRAVSPHAAVINCALGDGSVRTVSGSISGNTWYAACTPNGTPQGTNFPGMPPGPDMPGPDW
jgi:hypothetical protein